MKFKHAQGNHNNNSNHNDNNNYNNKNNNKTCIIYEKIIISGMKRPLSVTYAPREKILGSARIWSNRRALTMPIIRFPRDDKEVPEHAQVAPLMLWAADEEGCVCREHNWPEDGGQEEPGTLGA